jgi:Carboxypeptidase regulatory-like domain
MAGRNALRNIGLLAALSLPAIVAPGAAAARGGRLNGTVVNAKGTPVAALVFWQAADGTGPHALRTDAQGRFHITRLRGGLYDLRAEARGRWSEWEHNVVVRPGGHARVTLHLVRTSPPRTPPRRAGHAPRPGG